MTTGQKQYGLLVPKKLSQGTLQPRLAVFGDNSDSDNEDGADLVKKAFKKDSLKIVQKKQTQIEMKRALEQDPTVYQYDEVYDKIEEKKEEVKALKKDQEKKPRYIQSLLKQAERRKREQERRVEREVQKERQAEGDEFKDKEEFVTSAYRKKLEEFKKLDEEEQRQDQLEALTDVSKQKDLSGFYRHLYKNIVGDKSKDDVKVKEEKLDEDDTKERENSIFPGTSKEDIKEESINNSQKKSDNKITASPEKGETSSSKELNRPITDRKSARQYRKRRSSSSDSEKEATKQIDKNIDADSDFTGNSSSDSDSRSDSSGTNRERKKELQKKENVGNNEVFTSGSEEGEIREANDKNSELKRKGSIEGPESNKKIRRESSTKDDNKENNNSDEKEVTSNKQEKKEEKPKQSIWEKRTVGPVFEAALERYFARKAARTSNR